MSIEEYRKKKVVQLCKEARELCKPTSDLAPEDGLEWVAWKCPACGRSNDRKHEGLDSCDHCKCEVATYYGASGETLNVKWYRQATPEEMRNDLIAGGWKPWNGNPTVWEAPFGGIWRGPALAWHVMNNLPWPPNDQAQRREAI